MSVHQQVGKCWMRFRAPSMTTLVSKPEMYGPECEQENPEDRQGDQGVPLE